MVVFIFFALVLYFFIMFIFKIKKDKNYAFLASIACSILLIFTYIFNMGWIRLMYIFLFLAHIILFSISSIKMSKCLLHKNDTLLLIILYCVSLIASLSLPDQGDIGASYAFMGLVSPADYNMIFPISLYVVSTVLSLYLLGKSISEKHEINL